MKAHALQGFTHIQYRLVAFLKQSSRGKGACNFAMQRDGHLNDVVQPILRMYATGQAWAHCPRSALRRVLRSIKKEYALTFRIGQETEFYVLGESILEDRSRSPEPVDSSLYCQSYAYDNVAGLMDDISEAVESLSIPVEQLHAESGPGQFEIAVAPAVGNPLWQIASLSYLILPFDWCNVDGCLHL